MIFKQLKQGIDDVFAIGNSLTQINNLKLDATNITGYATALKGLTVKQAELVLSTKGLTVAQQQAILAEAELLGVTGRLTTAELNAILVNKKRNKDQAEALLIKTGLITAETSEATATNVVTAAKLKELVQTKALTQAEADLIAAKAGVTLANQKESASFLAGVGSKIKGLGSGLKSAGTGVLALAKAHPVIAAITTALTIGTVAVGIYKKKQEEAAEAIREAYENAKTAIEEVNSTFKNTESTTKQIAEEYAELAQGVNLLSNENKKLSTEKYERFLELSNQLSTLYPSLTKNYDENGNAILDLSGDVDTIVGSLDDLIERQRALANQEIVEQMPDLFAGYTNNVADFKEQLDEAEKAKEAVQSAYDTISKYGIYTAFDITGNAKDANGDPVALKLGQYISLLETLGITAKQVNLKDSMGQIIGYKLELEDGSDIPNISGIHDAYVSQFNKTIDDVKYAKMQLDSETSSINQYLNTWLQTEFSYNQIESDGLQKAIQETLFNFDWSSLPEGIDKNDWEAVSEYLRRNVLFSINNIDNTDVSQALADIYTGALTSGELLNAISKVQEYFGEEHPISVALEPKVNDVQPLVNSVKDLLKGTEFDDKVGELGLDDLKIASELDVPLDSIESWEELLALIQKVKDETFNNEITVLSGISTTVENLNKKVKPVLDSLKSAYQDIFTEDGFTLDNVGVDMLNSVKESIAEINEIEGVDIATSTFEDFARVLSTTEVTMIGVETKEEEVHKAFNDLVGDIINGTDSLNVSSEAVNVLVQSLEEMGVTNAKDVVDSTLAIKDSLKKLANEAETDVSEINNYLTSMGVNAVSSSNDLTECTWEEIDALMVVAKSYDFSADKIKEYAAQKIWSNQNALDVSQDISQLLVVAKSAGIATKAIARYEEAKKLQKQGYGGGQGQVDALMKSAYQEVLDEIQTLYDFKLPEYKPKDSSSSSKSSKDSASDIDWIETKLNNVDKALDKLNNTIDDTYSNWTDRSNALKSAITDTEKAIGLQRQAYDAYMAKANSVNLPPEIKELVRDGKMWIQDHVDSDTKELIDEYSEWYNKALDAQKAQDELNQTLNELNTSTAVDMIEEYYDAIDEAHSNSIESTQNKIDKAETMGFFANGSYYDNIGEELAKQKSNLEKKKADLDKVLANSGLDKNSSSYTELQNLIGSISNEIQQLTIDIEDNKNAAQENEWNYFDYLRESVTRLIEEADFFIELMSNEDLFDDKGNFTKYADATLALHNSNYEVYMANVREYAEEMKTLEEDLADGKDVIDRYRELEDAQRDAIQSAQDERKAILDLVEEGYQKQLDYLNEIIDKKKEALSAEKSLYDYQKSISEKTKTRDSLRRQLDVYKNDNSEEGLAQAQKLSVELQKAENNLAEAEMEKMINDTEQMLDALSSEYEEWMNARLDNEDELLRQIQDKLGENGDINSTLKEISDKYGISMSDSLKTAIVDGKPFDNVVTAINNLIDKITGLVGGEDTKSNSTNTSVGDKSSSADVKQPTTSNNNQPNQPIDTQSKSESDNIFIPQKSVYPKDKLNKERSIVDRLKYFDFASDFSSRAIYYKKLGGSGAFTGSDTQNRWLLKKMKEVGYASGTNYAKKGLHWTQENGDEIIIRKSDGAILTPLNIGDKVVNTEGTNNLYDFANNPQEFLARYGMNYTPSLTLPKIPNIQPRSMSNEVNLGGVHIAQVVTSDAKDFMRQLPSVIANDTKTQKVISEVVLGGALGRNSMSAKRFL